MCPRGLDGMHIRKCNETAGRGKEGRGRSQRVGAADFSICEMLAKLEEGEAAKIIRGKG